MPSPARCPHCGENIEPASTRDEWTTIRTRTSTLNMLRQYMRPLEDKNFDDVLRKLMAMQGEIYVEVLAIDGKTSGNQVVTMQIGDKPPRYYQYNNGQWKPLDKRPEMILVKKKGEK